MNQFGRNAWIPALLVSVTALACGGGGGAGSGSSGTSSSSLSVNGCSLGCSSGGQGLQVSCGTTAIFVNQEISVEFTKDIDLSTVTKNTFQVTDLTTGKSPVGSFLLSPSNPRLLIFRPQLTFDSQGNPVFGLAQGESYTIKIPGTAQNDPAPYVRSLTGQPNSSRLLCTVAATLGINDATPGAPSVSVLVDQVASYDQMTGEPATFNLGIAADGAIDVFRDTEITLVFNDIMNPATLVNPVTGESTTIEILVDPDGNPADASDQTELFGSFQINIDQAALTTTVRFKPSAGLPSAGTGTLPRQIVVNLPNSIVDLGGNPLSNAGAFSFVPEVLVFSETILPDGVGELFDDQDNQDSVRSGGTWALGDDKLGLPSGALQLSLGGGSGRLGDLALASGETLVFNTTNATFTGRQVLAEGLDVYDPDTGPSYTVTDGIFEFASLTVPSGSTLRFTGAVPARLFVRGRAEINGLLDVSGESPIEDADGGKRSWVLGNLEASGTGTKAGGFGGVPGPAGGDGGLGGARPDNTGSEFLVLAGIDGITNPGGFPIDGSSGEGVGGAPVVNNKAGGSGGVHFPTVLPVTKADEGGVLFNLICSTGMVGGSGGGGGFATDGLPGDSNVLEPLLQIVPANLLTPAVEAAGGSSALIDIADLKDLNPEDGDLLGGSGGGGGGAHVGFTKTAGFLGNCGSSDIFDYYSHSAAGGGGGGGALQLQAGGELKVDGVIDATGGRGGSTFQPNSIDKQSTAMPGGGGSGGSVLLQAKNLLLSDVAGRVTAEGGLGGAGPAQSIGGAGGAGLVRLENEDLLAQSMETPGALLQREIEYQEAQADKILPFGPAFDVVGQPPSSKFLSVKGWQAIEVGPGSFSGSQSCWLRPSGNFFQLVFVEDDLGNNSFGWDMDVLLNVPGSAPVSFRDSSDVNYPFGSSIETIYGNLLGSSPIVVRFQGARSVKAITNLCDLDENDPSGEILPESVTAWVSSPEELNTYFNFLPPQEAGKLSSNLIRFQVLFDRSTNLVPDLFLGVDNLKIRAIPD